MFSGHFRYYLLFYVKKLFHKLRKGKINMTKGFLTIAYGDYYHKLAENLLLSYRYSVPKEHQLPFAVIVDKGTP